MVVLSVALNEAKPGSHTLHICTRRLPDTRGTPEASQTMNESFCKAKLKGPTLTAVQAENGLQTYSGSGLMLKSFFFCLKYLPRQGFDRSQVCS